MACAQKLADNGLLMSNFILRNITFSPEYAASVEQKQIAEQLAQQAKLIVEQRKQEAEQARQQAQGVADSVVIRAKGDAESRLIQAEAEAQALELIAKALQDKPGAAHLPVHHQAEPEYPGDAAAQQPAVPVPAADAWKRRCWRQQRA